MASDQMVAQRNVESFPKPIETRLDSRLDSRFDAVLNEFVQRRQSSRLSAIRLRSTVKIRALPGDGRASRRTVVR